MGNEIIRDLFAVRQVDKYDGSKLADSYIYTSFSGQALRKSEDFDNLIEEIIGYLRGKQTQKRKLIATPLSVLKDDINPNTYKKIESCGISNMYELRMSIHRRYNGKVTSKIAGIGQKNGTEVINALEKHGVPSGLFTERWE